MPRSYMSGKDMRGVKLSEKMIVTLKECYNIQCKALPMQFLFTPSENGMRLIDLARRGFIGSRKCHDGEHRLTCYVTKEGIAYLKRIGYI